MEAAYPSDELEFADRFGTEGSCHAYLERLRWPEGLVCPRCEHRVGWKIRRWQYQCAAWLYPVFVTAGTILQDTHKSLRLWFRTAWYVTAWSWLHNLRRAMVRPGLSFAH